MTDLEIAGAPSLTAEESAFFESGGNAEISDTGSDDAGGGGNDGSGGSDAGERAPAVEKAPSNVPLAALHEERNRRRELDKKNRDLETQIAELRGKFSIVERLNIPAGGNENQPKPPPTVEEDIFGAVRHVGETVAQMQKRLDDDKAAKETADREATERNTFVTNYRQDADKFKATAPDYMDAYNFLLQSRAQELQAIGYTDPQELHHALTADEFAIAQRAFQIGKSPAEMLYGLAKQRGYKGAAAPASGAKPSGGAERLDAIERGQAANKSLSATGGPGGDADMTAERLLAMPLDEFEAWSEKNPAKARRLMGG